MQPMKPKRFTVHADLLFKIGYVVPNIDEIKSCVEAVRKIDVRDDGLFVMYDEKQHEWQPIETAPKDGKRILVFCSHSNMTIETCWLENSGFGWWWNTHHLNPPTHWMPLPKPPITL
jgi:hypothetical protein